jgi:hypothetical protein
MINEPNNGDKKDDGNEQVPQEIQDIRRKFNEYDGNDEDKRENDERDEPAERFREGHRHCSSPREWIMNSRIKKVKMMTEQFSNISCYLFFTTISLATKKVW